MLIKNSWAFKVLIVLAVAFSMISLQGSITSNIPIPSLRLAHAVLPPCIVTNAEGACSEPWYPAGSAMDTLQTPIFADAASEYACLQQLNPCIDLTDSSPPPITVLPGLISSPNVFVSDPVSMHSYFDIQFLLANSYWGVNMNFGNDPTHAFCATNNASATCAGLNIRQGIAHLLDKASFVKNDPNIAGAATVLDNPVPQDNGGLPTPNPCAWDILKNGNQPNVTPNCVVGSLGGVAYHVAAVSGANFVWQANVHDPDFCVAADHFVLAGLATGHGTASSSTGCVLTGIASTTTTSPVQIFARKDDPARLNLGTGLTQSICALFTGTFVTTCPEVTFFPGLIQQFPGFVTSPSATRLNWWIYTGGFTQVYPFDSSLYFLYNSRFVSGTPGIEPPNGPCSSAAVASISAANYMYLCNPAYDSISSQMEFAPDLATAIGFGQQAEDAYGQGAFSIPVFDNTARFAYLTNWQRVINGDGVGIPNYFTWLDAQSSTPAVPGTVRQGFAATTTTLNPYVASTIQDFRILDNIYDQLTVTNPLDPTQLLNWMVVSSGPPRGLSSTQLTYVPPAGTVTTFRYTLRGDLFFHDGRRVTSFDVAYSYLSLEATGAFQSGPTNPIAGITILGPEQFDVNINAVGPFTFSSISSMTVLPGRYWTNAGSSSWDAASSICTGTQASVCYPVQYTLGAKTFPAGCSPTTVACMPAAMCALNGCSNFPAADMNPNPAQISPSYDPLASGTLIGSGPYECRSTSGVLGSGCSSSGAQNPPAGGSYALTRFGKGFATVGAPFNTYFRSSDDLALCIWSNPSPNGLCGGNFAVDFVNFTTMATCFQKPVGTPGCVHWQMGIGNPSGDGVTCCVIGINQISEVDRFVGVGWVSPFAWNPSQLRGIGSFPPVLYEGSLTLNPATVAGCNAAFPTGGYDC